MSNLSSYILDIFFPKQCLNCGAWGKYICGNCQDNLLLTDFQRCIVCQKNSLHGFTHPKCQNSLTPERLISIFRYQDKLISKLINSAKLAMVAEIFNELAEIAVQHFTIANSSYKYFTLCPIPLQKKKQRFRGFNQSEIICQVIAQKLNLAIDKVLFKQKATKQQKLLGKDERHTNIQNSFKIIIPQSLPDKIILIDDIVTTGSTLLEATKVLKRAGVKEVWCLALAQD